MTDDQDRTADQSLLASLSPRERRLVEQTLHNHPTLTVAEAVEALREAGM